jgi:hypothetical protein
MPLVPQQFAIPLAFGLNQKADPRALEVPAMTICADAQFDEIGGVQTRYPYASIGSDIFGGGTLADVRQIVANGNELLCFTETELYSLNVQLNQWVLKGEHLAVKTTEESKFVTTGDQVDCDRAELDGTVFYAWTDGTQVYVAAVDKETGSVMLAPFQITSASSLASRPRLTALVTSVLLTFYDNTAGVYCYAMDPADPATALAGAVSTLAATGFGAYDIEKQPGADVAVFASRLNPTTSYRVGVVSAAGVVTATDKARTCAGVPAIACDPTGTSVQVIRRVAADLKGDLITIATLADVTINQAIATPSGSTPNHVVAAYRSVTDGGFYRCYVFWSDGDEMESNWVDTAGTIGTPAFFAATVGVASRAFDHDGSVYVWTSFVTASGLFSSFSYSLQNTYFLYRDDSFLVAKAAVARAGDDTVALLPNVQKLSATEYAWAGTERRIIPIGGDGARRSSYGARAPRDILFTFDSSEARRTARIGQTLYIACGEGLLQYDGTQLTETGFHIYPYTLVLGATTGSVADGTYAYRQTWRWDNARGEVDRSTAVSHEDIVVAGGPEGVTVQWAQNPITHKTDRPIAVETWRTAVDPTDESPFYLVTSKDPGDSSNPNRYLANAITGGAGTQLNDALSDADLLNNEASAQNGGYLEPLAPPPASIVVATADRLFLAGVAGDPDRVWYSRLRGDNEVASFHDALTINVPREGGDITALAFINETLVVFRETAIYALTGDGFDNLGGGQNYGPARALSIDVGAVNHESVALFDKGLIFKSSKGWYLLNKGWSCDYIGGPVCDYDDEEVVAVHVMEAQHQIRCLTTDRMLVLDSLVNQWAEWTISDGVHAAIWRGTYHYLGSAVLAEQATHDDAGYGLDIETAWIPLGQVQGFGRVWKILLLGEYRSECAVRIRLARNYLTTYFQDKTWTVTPTTAGGPLQLKHGPSIQEMQAIKIRITAATIADSTDASFVSAGTAATTSTASGTIAPAWPTHVSGDVALLHLTMYSPTGGAIVSSLLTANGFELLAEEVYAGDGFYWIHAVYGCRATSAAMAAPVVQSAAGLSSLIGVITTYRGCASAGVYHDVLDGDVGGSDTAVTIPGGTTTQDGSIVVASVGFSRDAVSTAEVSGWANASLASITERFDQAHAGNTGGGLGIATGVRTTAGTVTATTATLGTTGFQQRIAIALRPTARLGEALKLTSLGLELGVERGLFRLPAAQRQ